MTIEDDGDTAKKAVMRLNAEWPDNKNYMAHYPSRIASGLLHRVTFEGSKGEKYTNYAFRRGETTKAYHFIEDFINDSDLVASTFRDPDYIRLVVAAATSAVLCIAVIAAVFLNNEVGVLAGLFGTAFGYAVGSHAARSSAPR